MKCQVLFSLKTNYFRKSPAILPADDLHKMSIVSVEILWPSQPSGVMSSPVSLPNHTFTGQA